MYLRSKCLSVFIFLCLAVSVRAQESFRVLFYNVENLFDCTDDTLKNDNEFLPDAVRHWTPYRYRDKLKKLAKVIVASGGESVPDLVGLCEVENDICMRDLVKFSLLKEAGYRYVMTDSPDQRGIDVALLYQRGSFRLLQKQDIRIPKRWDDQRPTRDILHVVGQVISGDTLDVFVYHAPSRSGGTRESEPFRLLTAGVLKHTVDSLMEVRRNPYVLLMGDFNDYPTNKSVCDVLGALPCHREVQSEGLYNLMHGLKEGTYRYRGEWGILDQFIVSGSMLQERGGIRTLSGKARIFRHPFLLTEDAKYGGDMPFRTYNGMRYLGGFSDHLPIALDLEVFIRGGKDCYSR